MIVFAAIDLQQGDVVQLVGGRAQDERVRWTDPLAVAAQWQDHGFRALHVIDLDAARGTGSNLGLIEQLIEAVRVPVQVGGGMRNEGTIARLLSAGAERVIVGTRALEDADWRRQLANDHPGRIVVAADVRDHRVLTRGWTEALPLDLAETLTALNEDPLAAVLVTDVGREGRMTGIDAELFAGACTRSVHPLFAAGGIRSNEDVATLQRLGAAGAVLGMALYTGSIDASTLPGVQR